MKYVTWGLGQIYALLSYYVIAVIVMVAFSESMNLALRFWSDGGMTFWENGLWQLHFFTAAPIALYVYINEFTYFRERF
ncbi:hypothetical protein LRP49_01590 [Enterovibrio sp. ZSDZ35]|uniref:Uncharacterized protein n=1 Tax=Enterovibrio qingdaonensis TaxID=2899818 RepID=A0ABT5QFW8_9GAMM|nr:hypothetical protein [Enterovibrio sp. ZSDZ35]MDD1779877.1 hypothetical protein [Enterovibrio sp. ZSDZ35]